MFRGAHSRTGELDAEPRIFARITHTHEKEAGHWQSGMEANYVSEETTLRKRA